MSITWLLVSFATLVLFGSFEPAAILAAFFSSIDAGGDLVIKVKLLSLKTVMTTGRMSPTCFWVTALNSLQKAIILTPFCPRAGPTGGAGLAWPAGICSLMVATTSFAIVFNVVLQLEASIIFPPANIPTRPESTDRRY